MKHLATISEGRFERKPSHVECSCGVAGDFASETEARDWMESQHFAKLTGIAYGEFLSATPNQPSEPTPEKESVPEGDKKKEAEAVPHTETVGGDA